MPTLKRLFVVNAEVQHVRHPLQVKTIYGGGIHYTATSENVVITREVPGPEGVLTYYTTKNNIQVAEWIDCSYVWMRVIHSVHGGNNTVLFNHDMFDARVLVSGDAVVITVVEGGAIFTTDANNVELLILKEVPHEMSLNDEFSLPKRV